MLYEVITARCVLLGEQEEITREHLLSIWKAGSGGEGEGAPRFHLQVPIPLENPDLKTAVKELERQLIRLALDRCGGSRPRAAELLGISHPALLYKAREYGIVYVITSYSIHYTKLYEWDWSGWPPGGRTHSSRCRRKTSGSGSGRKSSGGTVAG